MTAGTTNPGPSKSNEAAARVLVVEGDASVLRSLEELLARNRYSVISSGNADEGYEIASTISVDAILLPDKWSDSDSVAFLRRLEEDVVPAPVIVSSAAFTMERVIDLMRAGAVDMLRRPLEPTGVVDAVARAVDLGRRQRISLRPPGSSRSRSPTGEQAPLDRQSAAPLHAALLAITEGIRSGSIDIPAVPAVVLELREALRDPKTSLDDLAKRIQKDQNLAGNILKLSNSAVYARGVKNSDLKTAVSRIGLKQVEALIETVYLHDCYQPRDLRFKPILARLWQYSVAFAIAARSLTETVGRAARIEPGTAYVSALLCDVGASFLLGLISERVKDIDLDLALRFMRERHEAIGAQVLTRWELDPAVVQLASAHHQVKVTGASPYGAIAALAAEIADRAVPNGDVTARARLPVASVARAAESLKVTEATLRKMSDQLDAELTSVLEVLS